ncbi:MAG TPA: hypothetical protein VMV49_15095 [Candidatus Deferrimicrobium sp.]|nr:hypothetical protein [Candidatus Deferrimicrobium sp.]
MIILMITSLFSIVIYSFSLNKRANPVSHLILDDEPNQLKKSSESTENFTSNSMEIISGNAIYDELLQNPNFTSESNWSFMNSTNITSIWSSDKENAWIFHTSNATPISIENRTELVKSENLITYQNTIGQYINTHVLDAVNYEILEGGPSGSYGINAEFLFNSSLSNITLFNINLFGSVQDATDPFSCDIYNFLDMQWESLFSINSVTPAWFNGSKSQPPNEYRYINISGIMKLRIYDFDATDTKRERVYLDYIEISTNGTSILVKKFDQTASINQTFSKDFNTEKIYSGVPPVILNFSYQVETILNVYLLELRVNLWNSTQFIGLVWSIQPTEASNITEVSLDISNYLSESGTYSINVEVYAQISSPDLVNFSVRYDNFSLLCQNSSGLHRLTQGKDNRVLQLVNINGQLDIRFNFTVPEGNLTICIYFQTSNPFTIWAYNFTSSIWNNLTNIQTSSFDWTNISNIRNFDYVEDNTNTLILRYTNTSGAIEGPLLIDYHSLKVSNYPSELVFVQTNPEIVQAGSLVKTQINFTTPIFNTYISGATILTNYTEDSYLFYDFGNGLYNITFYTDLAVAGTKEIQILAVREGFENATILISFVVVGAASELQFISGVTLIYGRYWANPAPFPNDQTKEIQILFNGSSDGPIDGAIIQARLNITGQLLPYEDLGNTIGHQYDGYYNITLNTVNLHDGQVGRVNIKAIAEGYLASELNFTFQVIKIPSNYLSIETDNENFTVYEGENIQIGATFKDLFHDKVLFPNPIDGNLTWRINSSDADEPHLMNQILLVYLADISLPQYNITPGIYNLTIETWAARDYENIQKSITLEVLPKQNVSLTLLAIPSYILAGTQFNIQANLTITDGSPIINVPLSFKVKFEPGALEIPETRLTNSDGIAELTIEVIPAFKSIQIEVSYQGNSTVQNKIVISNLIPIIILNSSLTLNPLPDEIMIGKTLEITAILLINGTANINKTIIFTIRFKGLEGFDRRTAETDDTGKASINFNVPSGVSALYVTASYNGLSYETSNSTLEIEVSVISILTLILRYAPIWLSIIGVVTGIVLVSYLRKRIIHLTKFQKEIQKLKDQMLTNNKIEKFSKITREEQMNQLLDQEISTSGKNNKIGKFKEI